MQQDNVAAAPEAIAATVTAAINSGRIKTLRDITPLLMSECRVGEADALAITEAIGRKYQDQFFPAITRMELFLTENCNLRCDYCFVHGKNAFQAMGPETARRAVDFLVRESRDKDELAIFFMGGEPFLEFDIVRLVAEYAEQEAAAHGKKVSFSTTTNGTVFTEEMLAFCRDHRISFLLSLDGDEATHDRHRKTATGRGSAHMILERLPLMRTYQPYTGVRMTVQPDAAGDVLHNFEWLADLGANHFIIGPASGVEWPVDALDTYEQQMLQVVDCYRERVAAGQTIVVELFRDLDNLYDKPGIWGCQAGRHSITVAADGDLYACSKMLGLNDLGGIYRLGDLEHGITDLSARAELVGMWPKANTECMSCDVRDACAGGCFATNFEATGSVFEPDHTSCEVLRRNVHVRAYAQGVLRGAKADADGEAPCVV